MSTPFLDRCPFMAEEVTPIVRRVAKKGARRQLDSDELMSRIVLKVLGIRSQGKSGQIPKTPAALQRFTSQARVDHIRDTQARIRCSECLHYQSHQGVAGGQCRLHQTSTGDAHPWFAKELDAHTDPRKLGCDEFNDRRRTESVKDDHRKTADATESSDTKLDLKHALTKLMSEDPVMGLLVAGSARDGRSKTELAQIYHLSRDQVSDQITRGLERLRNFLGDKPKPSSFLDQSRARSKN